MRTVAPNTFRLGEQVRITYGSRDGMAAVVTQFGSGFGQWRVKHRMSSIEIFDGLLYRVITDDLVGHWYASDELEAS